MNDHHIIRNYVLGATETVQQAPEGQVRLDVISEVLNGNVSNSSNNWKNFSINLTIAEFKKKLEMFAGTQPQFQRLQLFDKEDKLVADVDDDSKTLAQFGAESGMKIFVIDLDPNNMVRSLQDTSNVEKFSISDEEYNKREGTYRKWKEQNPSESKKIVPESKQKEECENIKVGNRCEVEPGVGGDLKRKGTVMYVGPVDGSSGFWVGVKLDEPLGKNDGSLKGKRYFDCPDKYGSFVRPEKVTVGDFPEDDLFSDEI